MIRGHCPHPQHIPTRHADCGEESRKRKNLKPVFRHHCAASWLERAGKCNPGCNHAKVQLSSFVTSGDCSSPRADSGRGSRAGNPVSPLLCSLSGSSSFVPTSSLPPLGVLHMVFSYIWVFSGELQLPWDLSRMLPCPLVLPQAASHPTNVIV